MRRSHFQEQKVDITSPHHILQQQVTKVTKHVPCGPAALTRPEEPLPSTPPPPPPPIMTSRSPPISPDRAPHSAAGTPPAAAAAAAVLPPFRVRTVTAFVTLTADDFVSTGGDEAAGLVFGREAESGLRRKLGRCSSLLRGVRDALESGGYEVQTTRVATNPFGEWLFSPGGGVGGGPPDDPAAEVAAGGEFLGNAASGRSTPSSRGEASSSARWVPRSARSRPGRSVP